MADRAPLHVYLVAGEESGDRLGVALMRALKKRAGGAVRFSGVGGAHMAQEGLESLFPIGGLAVTGLFSIFSGLRRALKLIRMTADDVVAGAPDVLVVIDSPEFTLRVAKQVRRRAPSIPIVEYVSPSVWAWRPWRARSMRRFIDRIMALLPFEPAVHQRLGGPPCTFVGHPLSERVNVLRPDAAGLKRREEKPPVVLLMPGSRRSELERMLELMLASARRLEQQAGPIEFVALAVPSQAERLKSGIAASGLPIRIAVEAADKDAAMHNARAAIVKSGTGTLELALAGVPMVAIYTVPAVEAFIFRRLISAPSAILTNLILEENVVPELLQEDATVDRIADTAASLLPDGHARRAQVEGFKRLDRVMEIGLASPSDRAAAIVIEEAKPRS